MTRSQKALAAFFTFAGVMHFVIPRRYEAIVPDYLPMSARHAVAISGVAEIAGGLGVVPEVTRPVARWWLIAVLAAVFPANVHMATSPEKIKGFESSTIPRWALWARLPLQAVFMLWVWRATEDH